LAGVIPQASLQNAGWVCSKMIPHEINIANICRFENVLVAFGRDASNSFRLQK
jgi:hypothetical protein